MRFGQYMSEIPFFAYPNARSDERPNASIIECFNPSPPRSIIGFIRFPPSHPPPQSSKEALPSVCQGSLCVLEHGQEPVAISMGMIQLPA